MPSRRGVHRRRRGLYAAGPASSSTARRPGALSSRRIAPPCRRATAATRLSPRPVPGRERLFSRRTKRRSARSRSCGATPGPRSATAISTVSPTRASEMAMPPRRRRRRWRPAASATEYLMALSTRLAMAWLTSWRLRSMVRPFAAAIVRPQPRLLGDRLVELGDVLDDRCRIDGAHALVHRAGLEPRDQQQRVEGLDQLVGLLDGLCQPVAIGRRAVGIRERRLGAVAQPVERRLEIVGDVVGDLAQGRHQLLDAVEHGVEALRQAVELVAGAVERDALGEVAGHDRAARLGDGLDAPQHAAADGQAGADAESAEQNDAPQRQLPHGAGEPALVLDIAADDQHEPARNATAARRRRGARRAAPSSPRGRS